MHTETRLSKKMHVNLQSNNVLRKFLSLFLLLIFTASINSCIINKSGENTVPIETNGNCSSSVTKNEKDDIMCEKNITVSTAEILDCSERTANSILQLISLSGIKNIIDVKKAEKTDLRALELHTANGQIFYAYIGRGYSLYKITTDTPDGETVCSFIE